VEGVVKVALAQMAVLAAVVVRERMAVLEPQIRVMLAVLAFTPTLLAVVVVVLGLLE